MEFSGVEYVTVLSLSPAVLTLEVTSLFQPSLPCPHLLILLGTISSIINLAV